jgi:hypothetical protein
MRATFLAGSVAKSVSANRKYHGGGSALSVDSDIKT